MTDRMDLQSCLKKQAPGLAKKIPRAQKKPYSGETKRQEDARADAAQAAESRRPAQNVPQFAPNFSVYVLPPDLRLPLLRGPEIFPSWRGVLRARHGNRQRRQELPATRGRIVETFSAGSNRASAQAADGTRLHRAGFFASAAPSTAIGRASACRPVWPRKIWKTVVCASKRSTSRARLNSARR